MTTLILELASRFTTSTCSACPATWWCWSLPASATSPKDSDNSMKLKAGNDPQQTNQTDDRFFIVHMDQGDNSIYLKQLHSGNYLSASSSGASLVPSRSEATSFKQFDCNGN
ncbi:hypothetical protein O3P69_017920 [Scylla paramamosain]|uniref:Uncharacterized protein n=1 Tax=Scylla paramamosain TaxID=85552 RepID=A0AAW0THG9_SCYPA